MKNYKNYYKKFVRAYAHLKPSSTDFALSELAVTEQEHLQNDLSNNRDGFIKLATKLQHAYLHYLLLVSLVVAAVFLIYSLKMSNYLAFAISLLVVVAGAYDALRIFRQRQKLQNLHCVNHVWTLLYSNGTQENLDLQSISRGLGLLFVLRFVSKESARVIPICVWSYQTSEEFLAYCSQLLIIGKKD